MKNKPSSKKMNSLFTVRNLINGVFAVAVIILLINAPAKALLIRGLMKIGFFQPEINSGKAAQPVSDVHFVNEKGQNLSLSSLKGKVVVINFWASWCPPCIAEMPSVNQLYIQLKPDTNIVILPVDVDNNFGKSLPFMAKNKYILPVYNTASQIPDALFVGALPTTVVIDRSGGIVFRHEGATDYTNTKFVKYLEGLRNR